MLKKNIYDEFEDNKRRMCTYVIVTVGHGNIQMSIAESILKDGICAHVDNFI